MPGAERPIGPRAATALLLVEGYCALAVEMIALRALVPVAGQSVAAGNGTIELTASFGVDVFESGHTDTPEAFVKRAEQYLYQAKQSGRNRVCHATGKSLDTDSSVSQAEKDALFGLFDGHGSVKGEPPSD